LNTIKSGIYGLKSDLHDVTKHLEELSLDELLDGSYKHPNLCPEKGEKASNGNENVLLSVRKSCSILPLHGVADNGGNRKTLTSIQNPCLSSANMLEKDEKDKCTEELCSKVRFLLPLLSLCFCIGRYFFRYYHLHYLPFFFYFVIFRMLVR